jgi:hypothetical protein
MSGASGLRPHDHTSAGQGGTIASGGAAAFKGVAVSTTSTQNVTDGAFDFFTAWSTAVRDDDGWAGIGGAHPDRLTAPYDCAVSIDVHYQWEAHASGQRAGYLFRNGITNVPGGMDAQAGQSVNGVATGQWQHIRVPYYELTSGQYVTLQVAQDSGATVAVGGDFSGSAAVFVVTVLELL